LIKPLYVINGIPVEQANLAALNPNDIESITILKDAQAVAMYGARAAQGVIVIESRKFKNEKIRFKFDNSFSYASQLLNHQWTILYHRTKVLYSEI
jgi:TonB-dependent SusC/RagA subfamily outer membrane receptor